MPTGPDWPGNAEKSKKAEEKKAGGIDIKDGLTLWLPLLLACLVCLLFPLFVHRRRRQAALNRSNYRGMSIGGTQNMDMQFLDSSEQFSQPNVTTGPSGSLSKLMEISKESERRTSSVYVNPLAGTAGALRSPVNDFGGGIMTNPLADFDLRSEQSAPILMESTNPLLGMARRGPAEDAGEDDAEEEGFDLMGWALDSTEVASAELQKVSTALVGNIEGVEEEDIIILKETMEQFQNSNIQDAPQSAVDIAVSSTAAIDTLQQKLLASVDYKAQRAKLAARAGVVTLTPTVKDLEYALRALEGTSSLTVNLQYVMEQMCQSSGSAAKALEEDVVPHLGVDPEAQKLSAGVAESLRDLGEQAAASIRAVAMGGSSYEQEASGVRSTLEASRVALEKLRTMYSEEDVTAMDEMQSLLDSVNRMRAQLRHIEHTVKEKVEEMTMSSELRAVLDARRAGKAWKGFRGKKQEEHSLEGHIQEKKPTSKRTSVLNPLSGISPEKPGPATKRTSIINPLSGKLRKAARGSSVSKLNPLSGRGSVTVERDGKKAAKRTSVIEMNPLYPAKNGS